MDNKQTVIMGTSMQELKDHMKTLLEYLPEEALGARGQINIIIKKIDSKFLEEEKKMMEDVFDESRLSHPMIGFKHKTFNDYYRDIFNNE